MFKKFLALLLCVTTVLAGTVVYAAEPGDMARDGVVYTTKGELFSAMRKAMLARQNVSNVYFEMTEALTAEINAIGLMELKNNMFDFYGDQMGMPGKEGDYLMHTYLGSSFWINGNSVGMDIYGSYTTADQEAAFDSKLASLFAGGGALAGAKSMSKADAVVACMNYINANVRGISSWNQIDHSGYGALCQGAATCQGKSLLLYRMLRELGIANRILMGQDAAAHTYNLVLIDGKYYYCDPSTTNIILKGSNSFHPSALQEQWQSAAFKNNIMSRVSATDYPLQTATQPQAPSQPQTPSQPQAPTQPQTPSQPQAPTQSQTPSANAGNTNNNTQQETVTDPVEYEILDGADSTYTTYQPGEEGLSLRAAGEIEKFVSVEVDGQLVDPKHYTVKEGSTIIIFTKEFMDTLAEGDHVVKFNFTDGFASANISVAPSEEVTDEAVTEESTEEDTELTTGPTEEGDKGSDAWIWVVVIIVLVAAGAAGVFFYMKKRQETSIEE